MTKSPLTKKISSSFLEKVKVNFIIDHEIDVELDSVPLSTIKKIKKKKLAKLVKGERVVFDEEGNAVNPYELESLDEFKKNDLEVLKQNHVNSKSEALKIADIEDKKIQKLKVSC